MKRVQNFLSLALLSAIAATAEIQPVRSPSHLGSRYHPTLPRHLRVTDVSSNRVSQKKRRLYARRAGKRVGQ